jgi:hypothetical protein
MATALMFAFFLSVMPAVPAKSAASLSPPSSSGDGFGSGEFWFAEEAGVDVGPPAALSAGVDGALLTAVLTVPPLQPESVTQTAMQKYK